MIPKECKRLAEVDFPIAIVGKYSIRDKKLFRNNPQAFHQWWARRPLAACRAMLLGLLLPDPCDEHCPKDFKEKARILLPAVQGKVGPKDEDLRKSLLKFIGDFANWDLSANQSWLDISRGLVKAAHPEETPLVVDPFAGGGSIPLEGLRLGCDVFASDLNPIPVLVLKSIIENIPRKEHESVEWFLKASTRVQEEVFYRLKGFYPKDAENGEPIAYIWARSVRCESPNCGGEIPLIKSLWLSSKAQKKVALKIISDKYQGKLPRLKIEVIYPKSVGEVGSSLVNQAKATCPHCHAVLSTERMRQQLTVQNGGANVLFNEYGNRIGGAIGLAVVRLLPGREGRNYRPFSINDYKSVFEVQQMIERTMQDNSLRSLIPFEKINPIRPSPNARGLSAVTHYGMNQFCDLFSARQLLSLVTLADTIRRLKEIDEATKILVSFALSRLADRHSSLVGWDTGGETTGHVFGRQALQMRWDFAEANPLSNSSGSLSNIFIQLKGAIESCIGVTAGKGSVQLANACSSPLPDETAEGWEAFLSGIINGGFVITASWPILTERARRLLAINTAALATSVHLVCRPRPNDAPVGD